MVVTSSGSHPVHSESQSPGEWIYVYMESFNSRQREELLNRELFLSLAEARVVLDLWRNE
jgi:putative transposase